MSPTQNLSSNVSSSLSIELAERKLERVLESQEKQFRKSKRLAKTSYQEMLLTMDLNYQALKKFSYARLNKILKHGTSCQRQTVEVFLYISQTGLKHLLYPTKQKSNKKCLAYFNEAKSRGLIKEEPCRICLFHQKKNPARGEPYHPDPFYPFNYLWICAKHLRVLKQLRIKPGTDVKMI